MTVPLAMLLSIVSGRTQFVAFNDLTAGDRTHSNATAYGIAAVGPLLHITNGQRIGVILITTNLGATLETNSAPPAPDTPAFNTFDGYVDFSAGTNASIVLDGVNDVFTLTFTGLNPHKRYAFKGTAVRGDDNFTNRWTRVELSGADDFTNAHSAGVLTTAQVPALAANQAALNTGANHTANTGDMVSWENIKPGLDGIISVTSRRFAGVVPGGSSDGTAAYGLTACRLEEFADPDDPEPSLQNLYGIKTVFMILMENHNWSTIKGAIYTPYINNVLLPMASHAEQYYTPTNNHPSLPNYLWLEAGTNFGIANDSAPAVNHQSTTNHFSTLLKNAGLSWRAYQEDITGANVPDVNSAAPLHYAVRHDPFVYFDDVRNNPAYCIGHIRPFTELADDLVNNQVARYNFITPNTTNDMHDLSTNSPSTRKQGDDWLNREVPKILASAAFQDDGALFIVWDEGTGAGTDDDGPIGLIVLSPRAKGGGYSNSIYYNHSSTLRTLQDIFGVQPYLREAAKATDLRDLFRTVGVKLVNPVLSADGLRIRVDNAVPRRTNHVEISSDLVNWVNFRNIVPTTSTFFFTDTNAPGDSPRFYRVSD